MADSIALAHGEVAERPVQSMIWLSGFGDSFSYQLGIAGARSFARSGSICDYLFMMFSQAALISDGGMILPDGIHQLNDGYGNDIRLLELDQFKHFERQLRNAFPHLALALVGHGKNPPDLMVRRGDEKPFGLELTSFGHPTEDR